MHSKKAIHAMPPVRVRREGGGQQDNDEPAKSDVHAIDKVETEEHVYVEPRPGALEDKDTVSV